MPFTQDVRDHPDPRVTGEFVRELPGEAGTLTLVGVVHDHPASVYRARRVVESVDPAVLALELPPISIPLFEQYAATERRPPRFGGEMSAAIQAATAATTVGIDRPTGGYFGRLCHDVLVERPSLSTVRALLSQVVSTTKRAVLCRFAAAVGSYTRLGIEADTPVEHDVDTGAAPESQARDEHAQVRRSRSFMDTFRTADRSRASRLEDVVREAEMATRLSELRETGNTVAIVGIDHLDPLVERLENSANAGG